MPTDGNTQGAGGARRSRDAARPVYCMATPGLDDAVREALAALDTTHKPTVIRECRLRERRAAAERRRTGGEPPADRRRIRGIEGRRVGDRRVPATPVEAPPGWPRSSHPATVRFLTPTPLRPRAAQHLAGARLALRFQGGDPDAFAELYRLYFKDVHSYVNTIVRNPTEAEDIAQQVFVSVFNALPRYEHRGGPFGSWILAIARNRAFDFVRRRSHVHPADPERIDGIRDRLGRDLDPHDRPSGDFDLMALVDQLPSFQRNILFLRFVVGMTIPEVSAALGRSSEAVYSAHYRGLAALERALEAQRHPRTGGPRRRHLTGHARTVPAPA